MKQYLVTAWDGTDENALERRMSVRGNHFDGARVLKANGNFIAGGAMLDDNGKMIGSIMIVQFDSKDELDQWMKIEPYIVGNVWQKITVVPFKLADV